MAISDSSKQILSITNSSHTFTCNNGKFIIGSFYEIDHEKLPPKSPIQLKSIRIVKVSETNLLNVTVIFPSRLSLRIYFTSFDQISNSFPNLDEKFVMSLNQARRILRRIIPFKYFESEKFLKRFWILNPSSYSSNLIFDGFDKGENCKNDEYTKLKKKKINQGGGECKESADLAEIRRNCGFSDSVRISSKQSESNFVNSCGFNCKIAIGDLKQEVAAQFIRYDEQHNLLMQLEKEAQEMEMEAEKVIGAWQEKCHNLFEQITKQQGESVALFDCLRVIKEKVQLFKKQKSGFRICKPQQNVMIFPFGGPPSASSSTAPNPPRQLFLRTPRIDSAVVAAPQFAASTSESICALPRICSKNSL